MVRITVNLEVEEAQALRELSQREKRDMRAQASLCIRHELERSGLLQPVTTAQAAQAVQHDTG